MIHYIHPGDPVAFKRPRFNGKQCFNDRRYTEYKRAFSNALRAAYRGLEVDEPVYLGVMFYQKARYRSDIDNLIKSVMDAIQQSGILKDDYLVAEVHAEKRIDRENPRVEVEMRRMDA